MKPFDKHEPFEKDVNKSAFTNQQIETIVHHFRQKVATLGNHLDVARKTNQNTQKWNDAMFDAEETHLTLEQMLDLLECKYKK